AMVTGGGRPLGTTPLQTQVPVPAPQPGEVQTFAFQFTLPGYQPATINASPVNNTISITAALAPAVQPQPVPTGGEDDEEEAGELRVHGQGGGPIYDNHTTTGSAVVTEDCTIDRLRVRLNGSHTYYGDLYITLRDPNGNSYSLARGGRTNPFRTHTVRRAEGRQARGRWTIAIEDRLRQDSGVLRSWSLSFRCR
ncbi:MAG TPA: proprotein convertase P-domain-containing protein, partial [Sandaracinaceae bacterium]